MERKEMPIREQIKALQQEVKDMENNCEHSSEFLSLKEPKESTGESVFMGSTITCGKCGLSVSRKLVSESGKFEELYNKIIIPQESK